MTAWLLTCKSGRLFIVYAVSRESAKTKWEAARDAGKLVPFDDVKRKPDDSRVAKFCEEWRSIVPHVSEPTITTDNRKAPGA